MAEIKFHICNYEGCYDSTPVGLDFCVAHAHFRVEPVQNEKKRSPLTPSEWAQRRRDYQARRNARLGLTQEA